MWTERRALVVYVADSENSEKARAADETARGDASTRDNGGETGAVRSGGDPRLSNQGGGGSLDDRRSRHMLLACV